MAGKRIFRCYVRGEEWLWKTQGPYYERWNMNTEFDFDTWGGDVVAAPLVMVGSPVPWRPSVLAHGSFIAMNCKNVTTLFEAKSQSIKKLSITDFGLSNNNLSFFVFNPLRNTIVFGYTIKDVGMYIYEASMEDCAFQLIRKVYSSDPDYYDFFDGVGDALAVCPGTMVGVDGYLYFPSTYVFSPYDSEEFDVLVYREEVSGYQSAFAPALCSDKLIHPIPMHSFYQTREATYLIDPMTNSVGIGEYDLEHDSASFQIADWDETAPESVYFEYTHNGWAIATDDDRCEKLFVAPPESLFDVALKIVKGEISSAPISYFKVTLAGQEYWDIYGGYAGSNYFGFIFHVLLSTGWTTFVLVLKHDLFIEALNHQRMIVRLTHTQSGDSIDVVFEKHTCEASLFDWQYDYETPQLETLAPTTEVDVSMESFQGRPTIDVDSYSVNVIME